MESRSWRGEALTAAQAACFGTHGPETRAVINRRYANSLDSVPAEARAIARRAPVALTPENALEERGKRILRAREVGRHKDQGQEDQAEAHKARASKIASHRLIIVHMRLTIKRR